MTYPDLRGLGYEEMKTMICDWLSNRYTFIEDTLVNREAIIEDVRNVFSFNNLIPKWNIEWNDSGEILIYLDPEYNYGQNKGFKITISC
jgi:hypothetical protein